LYDKSLPDFRMNLQKMITELQAEKARLDEAIVALERLSAGKVRKQRMKHKRPAPAAEDEELAEPQTEAAKAGS
jgi:hypothetical protein